MTAQKTAARETMVKTPASLSSVHAYFFFKLFISVTRTRVGEGNGHAQKIYCAKVKVNDRLKLCVSRMYWLRKFSEKVKVYTECFVVNTSHVFFSHQSAIKSA